MGVWNQKSSKSGGDGEGFPKAPAGNHPAVLVAVIDMGSQRDDFDKTKVKWQRRAYFVWELTAEPIPGLGRNFVIATDLTISLNEKAKLRKWIEARVGKQIPEGVDYDVRQELGKKCLLNVSIKNDFPKIDGMGSVPKTMTVPDPKCKPFLFELEEDGGELRPLDEIERDLKALPNWLPYHYGSPIADVIRGCRELTHRDEPVGAVAGEAGGEADSDEIPF